MKKQYVSPDMMFLIWGSNEDLCAKLGGRYMMLGENPPTPAGPATSTAGGDSSDLF